MEELKVTLEFNDKSIRHFYIPYRKIGSFIDAVLSADISKDRVVFEPEANLTHPIMKITIGAFDRFGERKKRTISEHIKV